MQNNPSLFLLNISFFRDVNSVEQDNMRLDVWDFNPEESVNDKLNKFNQVQKLFYKKNIRKPSRRPTKCHKIVFCISLHEINSKAIMQTLGLLDPGYEGP